MRATYRGAQIAPFWDNGAAMAASGIFRSAAGTLLCLSWGLANISSAQTCALSLVPGAAANAQAYAQLADRYFQRKQTACAVVALEQGTRLAPKDPQLFYMLGRALHEAGRPEASQKAFARAVALDPTLAQAHLALGVVDHDLGDRDAALREWTRALQLDPASPVALDWVAKARMEAGQDTAAIDLLRAAHRDEPAEVDLLLAMSHAGMADQAIAPALATLRLHPSWRSLRLATAIVLTQRNRFQDASDLLAPALASNPHDAEMQLESLRILVLNGDLARAATAAKRYLAEHPESFDGLYLSGLIARKDGEPAAAVEQLQAALALKPAHFDTLFNLGAAEAALQRWSAARQHLEQAVALRPTEAEPHFQLAGVLRHHLGDEAAAKRQMLTYQHALAHRSRRDRNISVASQAAQQLARGDAKEAATLYRELVDDEPDNAVTWYNLALALDRTQELQGEVAALRKALQLKPTFAAALNQLGFLQASKGENKEAEVSFREAIRSAPQFAEAENNLGSLLASQGRNDEAERQFREAVAANPRLAEGWTNLAATLAARSQFIEAREAAQRAVALEPANANAVALLRELPSAASATH